MEQKYNIRQDTLDRYLEVLNELNSALKDGEGKRLLLSKFFSDRKISTGIGKAIVELGYIEKVKRGFYRPTMITFDPIHVRKVIRFAYDSKLEKRGKHKPVLINVDNTKEERKCGLIRSSYYWCKEKGSQFIRIIW